MQYDELKHFEKLLDEFEQDALAAAKDNSNAPSASKRIQRDLTRRNLVTLVEGIVLERDEFIKIVNIQPKGAVATVAPTTP